MKTSLPRIAIFSSKEPHLIKTELRKKNKDEEVLGVAEAIAKLGEDGWEMVSAVSPRYTPEILFFKRPKE
jgi:hypothetical protein